MTDQTAPVAPETSFENAYQELVTIVEKLESGSLSLEDSLSLFERGQALTRYCNALLDNAELRISRLGEVDTDESE